MTVVLILLLFLSVEFVNFGGFKIVPNTWKVKSFLWFQMCRTYIKLFSTISLISDKYHINGSNGGDYEDIDDGSQYFSFV